MRDSSAGPALLGYLYQVRRALLMALDRLRQQGEFMVRFEALDDVEFQEGEDARELVQTKHHLNRQADLADTSRDLWRTLEIWIGHVQAGRVPRETQLSLVTTAPAAHESAASRLRSSGRDVEVARQRLAATAETSRSASNRVAYDSFLGLSLDEQRDLLERVYVYDSEPDVGDLSVELSRTVFFAAPSDKLDSFLHRLEGWWFHRVVLNLRDPDRVILSEELHAEMARLRQQFREDDLPIDDDIMRTSIDASGYENENFVRQLQMIQVGNKRIFHAIRNYFRASAHRSRWTREELVVTGELERYEDRLIEEWDLLFAKMLDDLGEGAAEAKMKEAAQALYHWVETNPHPAIRPSVSEPSIARGTYQILANYPRIGWHPEWEAAFRELLESRRPA